MADLCVSNLLHVAVEASSILRERYGMLELPLVTWKPMALVDVKGQIARVGSFGFWLEASDFVVIGDDHPDVTDIGPHCFPRDWPDVYDESRSLRTLLKPRGPCAAKRVSVVPRPEEALDGLEVRFLQSFLNAEKAKELSPDLKVVEGWAIYDLLDDVTGAAFLAERYWWNETEDGTWVDYSPRPENMEQMLLAEALFPTGPKEALELTLEEEAIGKHLCLCQKSLN